MSAHMWEFCGIVHVACLYMQVIGFNSEEEELWPKKRTILVSMASNIYIIFTYINNYHGLEIDFWVGRVKFLFKEK